MTAERTGVRPAPRSDAARDEGASMSPSTLRRRADPSTKISQSNVGVGRVKPMGTFALYYYFIKIMFFFSLVRAQVKSDLLRDHFLFLSVLYTAAVAFLSYAFLVSWQGQEIVPGRAWEAQLSKSLNQSQWVVWLGETLVLSAFYFKLMAKFDEGVIFWTLLVLGILVALF
jgi:hypothetical protein